MAMLLGVSRLCCLMFYICGIQAYVSTESIEFREPTECSSNCSFINAQGELRECNVRQIATSLPTAESCPTLLPNQFLTNEVKDMPPRLDKDDVEGMFTQTSLNDLKVKIDIKISEPNHNRLNGVFFELKVAGNKDKIYGIQYCFLLDFNGTLKMKDIIPSYGPGGDLTLSFYPCIDASKSAYYAVVGYPLPLITKPMDDSRNNYQHAFNYFQWQVDECKNDAKRYLLNSELKIYDGRLEFEVNSSSLFNYNCPLVLRFIDTVTDEEKTVNFENGVASTSNIERGEYKMRFILDGMVGRKFSIKSMDVDVAFKGECLSFPCVDSLICQQHGKKTYKCSCPPGQILKGIECYNEYPCIDNPCGNGVCTRIETSTSVHHDCTCYRGFYKAHSTCLRDPCNDNPCGRNYECKVIELDSGIRHICDCNPGFFVTTDLTCEFDPCFNNLCGNGTCDRIKTDSGIERICQCYDGFYNFENTCKPNPCLNNPCMNGIGICIINEAVECNYECNCSPGFYATQDTCRPDPCFNIPCGVDRGICERNEDSGHNCRCFERFRLVQNTCLIDPCYNNPCGNGTCTIIANSSHSCDCYPGYEAVNDTCNRNYCFDNPCRPGNCTVKDNSFTCNCPSSYQLIDGKCLEKESIVMHAVVGLAGGLTGLFLILVFFYVKKCCPPHIDDPELKKVSSFDKLMLEDLKSRTSTGSSLAPSSSEHFSEQTTISFTNGQPLQPISCSSKYPPDSNGVLTSTYPYNHCHETCRLPCRIHQPRFQENWPRAEDIQHYPHSEEETFNWQTQVQYPRYISIDSQPSTSNHASVEYCTDRESSL